MRKPIIDWVFQVGANKRRIELILAIFALTIITFVIFNIIKESHTAACVDASKILSFYNPQPDAFPEYISKNISLSPIVDFRPSYCSSTYLPVWNSNICLGKYAIRTLFVNDGLGCEESGKPVIINGPTFQVYILREK